MDSFYSSASYHPSVRDFHNKCHGNMMHGVDVDDLQSSGGSDCCDSQSLVKVNSRFFSHTHGVNNMFNKLRKLKNYSNLKSIKSKSNNINNKFLKNCHSETSTQKSITKLHRLDNVEDTSGYYDNRSSRFRKSINSRKTESSDHYVKNSENSKDEGSLSYSSEPSFSTPFKNQNDMEQGSHNRKWINTDEDLPLMLENEMYHSTGRFSQNNEETPNMSKSPATQSNKDNGKPVRQRRRLKHEKVDTTWDSIYYPVFQRPEKLAKPPKPPRPPKKSKKENDVEEGGIKREMTDYDGDFPDMEPSQFERRMTTITSTDDQAPEELPNKEQISSSIFKNSKKLESPIFSNSLPPETPESPKENRGDRFKSSTLSIVEYDQPNKPEKKMNRYLCCFSKNPIRNRKSGSSSKIKSSALEDSPYSKNARPAQLFQDANAMLSPPHQVNSTILLILGIHEGEFGYIFLAKNLENGQGMIAKCNTYVPLYDEQINAYDSELIHEENILRQLHHFPGFCKIRYSNAHEMGAGIYINGMDILGPNLQELFEYCAFRFTSKTVLMLGIQMVKRLEALHSLNLLHRNIRPEHFAMGCGFHFSTVFLIDFRTTQPVDQYEAHQTLSTNGDTSEKHFFEFCSLRAHENSQITECDEIESLCYVLLYLYGLKLPWIYSGVEGTRSLCQNHSEVHDMKQKLDIIKLNPKCPKSLINILHHARQLRPHESPDYDYMRGELYNDMRKKKFKFDCYYDWLEIHALKMNKKVSRLKSFIKR